MNGISRWAIIALCTAALLFAACGAVRQDNVELRPDPTDPESSKEWRRTNWINENGEIRQDGLAEAIAARQGYVSQNSMEVELVMMVLPA